MDPEPWKWNAATSSGRPSWVRSAAVTLAPKYVNPWGSVSWRAGYHPPASAEYTNTCTWYSSQHGEGPGWCCTVQIARPPNISAIPQVPVNPEEMRDPQAMDGPPGVRGGPPGAERSAPAGVTTVPAPAPTEVGLVVGRAVGDGGVTLPDEGGDAEGAAVDLELRPMRMPAVIPAPTSTTAPAAINAMRRFRDTGAECSQPLLSRGARPGGRSAGPHGGGRRGERAPSNRSEDRV